MPYADITEARDGAMDILNTAWLADAVTQDLVIGWEGVDQDRPQATQTGEAGDMIAWGWANMRHVDGEAVTFGVAGRRFRKSGVMTVQLFGPLTDGMTLLDSILTVVTEALEGTRETDGIWFDNVRVNEVGKDGPWFQSNVLADFQYDTLR
jgi:hypothetical protein